MLKSESPPFGSLGGLGSHIADSPMKMAGAGSLAPQFSHSKPVPTPAAGGSHTTSRLPILPVSHLISGLGWGLAGEGRVQDWMTQRT